MLLNLPSIPNSSQEIMALEHTTIDSYENLKLTTQRILGATRYQVFRKIVSRAEYDTMFADRRKVSRSRSAHKHASITPPKKGRHALLSTTPFRHYFSIRARHPCIVSLSKKKNTKKIYHCFPESLDLAISTNLKRFDSIRFDSIPFDSIPFHSIRP
jgi:hypothetical protein